MSLTKYSMESISNSNDSKHYNMKQFINAAKEYSQTRAEDTASLINRHLQLLSVTIDLSTFDPHTSVVSEFFVSLHELLLCLEPRSALAWCCVNVLSTACRNSAAREALIHIYEFLPPLSRLLGDQLTVEKKTRLLTLMQELTCGIRISWQIPYLRHLMVTLTKWVESENEEIVTLSLGVLVNLCYKNLPAIYTLSRCVDIKKFIRLCMPLKGIKIEVHVCKLIIILDYINGSVPEEPFLKLMDVTFKSMLEAFRAKDVLLLRHIVEFFLDVKKQHAQSDTISSYENYATETERLISLVETNNRTSAGDSEMQEPECMTLLFEFIHSLIELKLPKLVPLYPRLISLALKWIQTDLVCSQALAILRTIAVNTEAADSQILEPLINNLPVFLVALDHEDEMPTHIEHNKRIGALMQLFRALVQRESVRSGVLASLKEEHIYKVFYPLIRDSSPRTRASDPDTYSSEAINLYVHALALVDQLAKADADWVKLYKDLLQQKQMHMILAQALYSGKLKIKSLVLAMAGCHMFPNEHVAHAMTELQSIIHMETQSTNTSAQVPDGLCFPIMSVTQVERLDELMNMLKEAMSQNNIMNVATSDVMELYEYKLASMGHAERAATASLEAASARCTHLQHRTAQLTAELSRLHQLLFHTQQCHEDAVKTRDKLVDLNKDLNNKVEAEKGRYKAVSSQLSNTEKTLSEKEQELEFLTKKQAQLEQNRNQLDEQNTDLKRVISKLEENLLKKEKVVEKKEELLNRANIQIEHFKMQGQQLEKELRHTEAQLRETSGKLSQASTELASTKEIINTITRLTNSQHGK